MKKKKHTENVQQRFVCPFIRFWRKIFGLCPETLILQQTYFPSFGMDRNVHVKSQHV